VLNDAAQELSSQPFDGHVVHAEGLNQEELERLLKRAESLAFIETKVDES
jgi:hypothetical protein